MMLLCTFCNKVFQGTQFQATRHFVQTNYCKDVNDEALYEIARRTPQKFESDQMERVARYAAERGLDVPDTGAGRGGEAGRHLVEGGVRGDGGHDAPDHPLGGGGGDTGERMENWLRRAGKGFATDGSSKRKEGETDSAVTPAGKKLRQPKVAEVSGGEERMENWLRRAGKGFATDGSSKRKEGETDSAVTPAGKKLRQPKVAEVSGGEWVARHKKVCLHWLYSSGVSFNVFRNQAWKAYQQVLLGQPGGSPRGMLPNHNEIASIRAMETHRAELAEELEEGMLDCQAGLEVEPVRMSTRRGMTEEEIARQVALITRDPIGASAPPSADAVFGRRACIFRPYPKEDNSDEEPVPEVVYDPALRISREIDETYDDPDDEETRAHTTRRAAGRADREILGGEEEFWDPFGEVASTGNVCADRGRGLYAGTRGKEARVMTPTPTRRESSMPPPSTPSPAPPSPVSPLQPATAAADTEELASSLPQHGLLQRGGAVRQRRLRSPSPGILQEEGPPSAAPVEGKMIAAAVADATVTATVDEIAAAAAAVLAEVAAAVVEEEAPAATVEGIAAGVIEEISASGGAAAGGAAAGGAAAVEGEVAATVTVEEEEAPSLAAVEGDVAGLVKEEIAAAAEVPHGGTDECLMQHFLTEELDPVIAGMTPGVARGLGISYSEMGTHIDFDLSMGLPPSCGGATSTDRAPSRYEVAGETLTHTPRERTTTESPDAARDIMERERARLMASSDPRAQAFARGLEERRSRETGRDGGLGGVVVGEDAREVVAAEAEEGMDGGRQAVHEATEGGQEGDDGPRDAWAGGHKTQTGPAVPFSGLHLVEARRSQPPDVAFHIVPPVVIEELGSEPMVERPRPRRPAPQEVDHPLDAEELAAAPVRDVTRLDRGVLNPKLKQPNWQRIPSVPWAPASPVKSGSTTSGRPSTVVAGVSGGV
ncbi:hypothetical protein CBR_g480 [Chara braunii]|uniref:Uncharacterized protein n=1 Tax=Chara braunii TaxID=69332 RepID=A0A388KBL3_CHABU|nr:hypothetical protein CBR_g480 [Chara braunii]|eukprot:GBG67343.1 hypothetical protein CBR_g480 [Chara braunii]